VGVLRVSESALAGGAWQSAEARLAQELMRREEAKREVMRMLRDLKRREARVLWAAVLNAVLGELDVSVARNGVPAAVAGAFTPVELRRFHTRIVQELAVTEESAVVPAELLAVGVVACGGWGGKHRLLEALFTLVGDRPEFFETLEQWVRERIGVMRPVPAPP
jgi:hypothetical protein